MSTEEDNAAFLDRLWGAAVEAHFNEDAPAQLSALGNKVRGLTLPVSDWQRLDRLRGIAQSAHRDPSLMHSNTAFDVAKWVGEARKHCLEQVAALLRS
jgi:hypothetical protein